MTTRKGQMSLEMVIGLLILLVVAAVVIKIFLGSVNNISSINDLKSAQAYQDFKNGCTTLCDQYKSISGGLAARAAAAKYCEQKFTGTAGLSQSILNKPIESDTKAGISVCPDGIYCFMAQECDTPDGVAIDWSDCKTILCQAYYDSYGDYGKASAKVMQLIPNQGSCTLPSDTNWFTLYGFGPSPPCGGSVGQTSQSTTTTTSAAAGASVTCVQASSSSVTCNWQCPNNIAQANYGYLTLLNSTQNIKRVYNIGAPSSSWTFTGLPASTLYNVGLICDLTQTNLISATTVAIQ